MTLSSSAVLDPGYITVLNQCGAALYREQNFSEALVCFRRADSMLANSWQQKLGVGVVYAAMQNDDSTLAYFTRAETLCPDSMKCIMYRGVLNGLVPNGYTAEAAQFYARSRTVCPSDTSLARIGEILKSAQR